MRGYIFLCLLHFILENLFLLQSLSYLKQYIVQIKCILPIAHGFLLILFLEWSVCLPLLKGSVSDQEEVEELLHSYMI